MLFSTHSIFASEENNARLIGGYIHEVTLSETALMLAKVTENAIVCGRNTAYD